MYFDMVKASGKWLIDDHAATTTIGDFVEPGVGMAINGVAVTEPAGIEAQSQPTQRRWVVEVRRDGRPLALHFRI
jgi:hypothetical protein